MKAYFSRRTPWYIITDNSDSDGFDAYPVEVDGITIARAEALQKVHKTMQDFFDTMPAPEEAAQQEADEFSELLGNIFWELREKE